MKVAVKDSCLLIDLEIMRVLDLWFQLKIETITTSMIVDEVRDEHPDILVYIESGAMVVVDYDVPDLIPLISELGTDELSLGDLSVLHLAEERDALLLTCDSALRGEAEMRKVDCHGSIWVLEKLVDSHLLPGPVAASKLQALANGANGTGRFLSKKLIAPYLEKWK